MTSNSINFSEAPNVNQLNPKYVKFTWTATLDSANNRWNITWNAIAQGGYNSNAYVQTQNGSITIAAVTGTASGAGTKTMSGPIPQTHNDDILLSGSFTLSPDATGQASFSVRGSVDFWTTLGTFAASSLSSTTQTLDVTAYPSMVYIRPSEYIITSPTQDRLAVEVDSYGDFEHLLWFWTDNDSTRIPMCDLTPIDRGETMAFWIEPLRILDSFPTAKEGRLYVECRTYTSNHTQVGEPRRGMCVVKIDTNSIKPSVSLSNIAVNSYSTQGSGSITDTLVAGYSTAKSTPTIGTGTSPGTTIASITYTITPGSFTKQTGTATSGTAIKSNLLPASTSNYTLTYSVTATDARGATNTATKTATVYGYASPKITTNIYRVASSGSTTRDDAGTYVRISFSASAQASVNNKNSMQSTTCTATGDISGSQTSGTWKALATDKAAVFTVTAKDKVSTVTTTVSITQAKFALELYDDKNGTLWAQSGGYFRSLKAGAGDNAGLQVRNATASTDTAVSIKRTDTNRGIELLVGSGGTNRGLYIRDGTGSEWLLYYNDTNLVFNKPVLFSSRITTPGLTSTASLGTNNANIFIGKTNDPGLTFYNSDTSIYYGVHYLLTETTNNVERPNRHSFRIYSYNSTTGERLSNYENYYLPTVNADRTGNASYTILTSKSTITVAQGGTGVTTAKGSAKNPAYLSSSGLAACNAFTELFSGTFNASSSAETLTNAKANYNYLIIAGKPNSSLTAISSVYVPIAMLTTSDQVFAFTNENYGCSVKLKYSGNNVVMTFNASTAGNGAVSKVYGGI